MSDVYVAFVRDDQSYAEALAVALQGSGFSVSRSASVVEAINECPAIVVLWSAAAARSKLFMDAADRAFRSGKMVLARMGQEPLPPAFAGVESHALGRWSGDPESPEIDAVVFHVDRLVSRARLPIGRGEQTETQATAMAGGAQRGVVHRFPTGAAGVRPNRAPPEPAPQAAPPQPAPKAPARTQAPPAEAAPESVPMDPLAMEAAFWRRIQNSQNVDDFFAYLERFGSTGAFSELAQARIRALTPPLAPEPHREPHPHREPPAPRAPQARPGASSPQAYAPHPAAAQPPVPGRNVFAPNHPPPQHYGGGVPAPQMPPAAMPPQARERGVPASASQSRPEPARERQRSRGGGGGFLIVLVLLLAAAGAGAYYFLYMRPPADPSSQTAVVPAGEWTAPPAAEAPEPQGPEVVEAPPTTFAAETPLSALRPQETPAAAVRAGPAPRTAAQKQETASPPPAPVESQPTPNPVIRQIPAKASAQPKAPAIDSDAASELQRDMTQTPAPAPVQQPAAAAASPPPPGPVRPIWAARPSARDLSAAYPGLAAQKGLSGVVRVDCLIGDDLTLSCRVLSEDPPGMGFGAAALKVARAFRAAPALRDGRPARGERTVQTIVFRS